MSDNQWIDNGEHPYQTATDDIAGVHHHRVKVTTGADGTANDVSSANPLPVESDTALRIAMGLVSGMSAHHQFGHNEALTAAGGYEDIWSIGGTYTGFDATAAEIVTVVSDNTADTSAGTGARTIQVYGLDASWAEQNETVTMNGTTMVDTVGSYIRLDKMIVLTAGSGVNAAGVIVAAQKVTTANIFCEINADDNESMAAVYTIPAAKTAYISGFYASLANNQSGNATIRGRARPNGGVFNLKMEVELIGDGASYVHHVYKYPRGPFAAKTDMKMSVDASANNMGVDAGFDVILVDD